MCLSRDCSLTCLTTNMTSIKINIYIWYSCQTCKTTNSTTHWIHFRIVIIIIIILITFWWWSSVFFCNWTNTGRFILILVILVIIFGILVMFSCSCLYFWLCLCFYLWWLVWWGLRWVTSRSWCRSWTCILIIITTRIASIITTKNVTWSCYYWKLIPLSIHAIVHNITIIIIIIHTLTKMWLWKLTICFLSSHHSVVIVIFVWRVIIMRISKITADHVTTWNSSTWRTRTRTSTITTTTSMTNTTSTTNTTTTTNTTAVDIYTINIWTLAIATNFHVCIWWKWFISIWWYIIWSIVTMLMIMIMFMVITIITTIINLNFQCWIITTHIKFDISVTFITIIMHWTIILRMCMCLFHLSRTRWWCL